jgi:hypothetical protein
MPDNNGSVPLKKTRHLVCIQPDGILLQIHFKRRLAVLSGPE